MRSHLVVDLEAVAVEGAGAQGDLGRERLGGCGGLHGRGALLEADVDGGAGAVRAQAVAVEGVHPVEAGLADGANVVAKEHEHAGLAGLQREEAAGDDYGNDEQHDAADEQGRAGDGRGHAGVFGGGEDDDALDHAPDGGGVRDEGDEEHGPAGCGARLLFCGHCSSFPGVVRARGGRLD